MSNLAKQTANVLLNNEPSLYISPEELIGGLEALATVVLPEVNEEFKKKRLGSGAVMRGALTDVLFVCVDLLNEALRFVADGENGIGVGRGMAAVVVLGIALVATYPVLRKAILASKSKTDNE